MVCGRDACGGSAPAAERQGRAERASSLFFFTEIGNALWKRWRRREISAQVAVSALEAIEAVQLTVWADHELLWDAVAIALRRGCSVYDSLYLALADKTDGRLVTADRRLVNTLAGTDGARRVVWIEDLMLDGSRSQH